MSGSSKRLEWVKMKIAQAFPAAGEDAINDCIQASQKKIDAFFEDLKSPPKLLFFYQQRQFKKEELYMSLVGDGEKLAGKCCWFLRNSNKPIKTNIANDNTVLSGEIHSLLQSLESTISNVYKPCLEKSEKWGSITREDDKQVFLDHVEKFDVELKKKIENLTGDVTLAVPQEPYDKIEQKPAAYARAAKESNVLAHFVEILQSWCKNIKTYMDNDPSNIPISPTCSDGPEIEIDYWARRMLTLISITEQLKSKQARVVTGVVKARALRSDDDGAQTPEAATEQQEMKDHIEAWREVDLAITDSLNEAKDNVRFLNNIRRVVEPLRSEKPSVIADSMSSIMNSMKMIHTLSRHYGNEVRMTNLFVRVTNQLITRCKEEIYQGGKVANLWNRKPSDAMVVMKESINLFTTYKREYTETKLKLAEMPKGKQFSFDEALIFGKFEKFTMRLEKVLDIFSSLKQFNMLEAKRIDGMEKLIKDFDGLMSDFRGKGHDLLDFNNVSFERDFVEFTMHNSGLESAIIDFMARSLKDMSNITNQLNLLQKFNDILEREPLKEDLQKKYLDVFRDYSDDLVNIQSLYEKHKENPPVQRFNTRIAGNIHWSRQLLRRITQPMKMFQENPKVFHPKESKKLVKFYNKLARTLIEFETLWFQAFAKSCDQAKKGLRGRLIVRDSNNELHVNFDMGVLQMMKEAKHLRLLDFKIPRSAQIVLTFEPNLKKYYAKLTFLLKKREQILGNVNLVVKSLLKPHLKNLDEIIAPAITSMTWLSMNVNSFIEKLSMELDKFENLVDQTNNVTANRIEANLNFVSNLVLLDMPKKKSFTLKDWKALQSEKIVECTKTLQDKNTEIELAVDDLISIIQSYDCGKQEENKPMEVNFVKLHYGHKLYLALLDCTLVTIDHLRRRVGFNGGWSTSPLFEVELSLQIPEVAIHPRMSEVQDVVQQVAREILQCTKGILDWGIDMTGRHRTPVPFFNKLAADKDVAVACILLHGALNENEKRTQLALAEYDQYKWLWIKDPESAYKDFVAAKTPILEDFLAELKSFQNLAEEIDGIAPTIGVGSMTFNTDVLKSQLKGEVTRWIHQYSKKLHNEVKNDMEQTTELMSNLKTKLERDTNDFQNVTFIMDTIEEITSVSSWISDKFEDIISRYNMLEGFLPQGTMSKDEMDAKSVLTKQWNTIRKQEEVVMAEVSKVAPSYKTKLIEEVKDFKIDVEVFYKLYKSKGPKEPGIKPREAMDRLNRFNREYETLKRKYETYNGGEKLFGLPEVEYPELVETGKDLALLDRLYMLYHTVITKFEDYKNIPWSEVVQNINDMNETVEGFDQKVRTLPKPLRTWKAYEDLQEQVSSFMEMLPLFMELSKPSMRPRHWEAISKLTGMEFDMDQFHELKLKKIQEAKINEYKDDIEEIADSADKQLAIEKKIQEIKDLWDKTFFDYGSWKERGDVILGGQSVTEIIEQLEESQSALVQMLTQRNVLPFKEDASNWLKKLSDVNDTLENWIKVQMLWMSLEAVFTGGDIARQMPTDTRCFLKVDKEWTTRLMAKAKDVRNVVECCQNEYIKNMLPTMFVDLEKCQKALDGYLEAKRSKFPRFYFVSNPALLLILSQGSDKEAVQDAFPKIFDAVDRVVFEGNNIVAIQGITGGYGGKMDTEQIQLSKPVTAKGNIEDWLDVLLKQMMTTVHDIVREASSAYKDMAVLDFIRDFCGQVSLMGIQLRWSWEMHESLNRLSTDKAAIQNATKNQQRILTDLSQLTTTEIPTKMERTKVETLVTIQVHQVDVSEELYKLSKEKKVKNASDFEWQKQLRMYWQNESDDFLIKCADVEFSYCNEYLGCKERLVITPLTDRCYISLTQAIGMYFGGAPAGPAGTGKTETTKDLGRALGKYVVVFNCSDQMHTADTAKLYKGLCKSGSWGCFDEFNRIELEVLSVVAQQVEAILTCLRTRGSKFSFPGDDIGPITVDTRCGFFITMNPGYAGRQELPENLKALFRGVAMMVPDRQIIMKVKLASVGYEDYENLSKKFAILYQLSEEQLSKQRHYDFGLRNILSVLRTGGTNLRIELKKDQSGDRSDLEEMLMMRTLRDMNLSKLVTDDVALFISLLHDLFPSQEDPEKRRYDEEEEAMKKIIADMDLIQHESWVSKIIQLYETSLVRHGLMMVGPAGGGKSVAIKVLVEALSMTKGTAKVVRMNPKAITAEEMFGQNDIVSGEWTHGIFSSIWAKYNDPKKHTTWIVCDGPVDSIWIENLNTVLDDNKLLTLANGDRVPMTDNVRILFENENLRNASPATVSRAGIVYVSDTDLGYEPIVEAWMASRNKEESNVLRELYEKYISSPDTFDWMLKNTKVVMKSNSASLITNLLKLCHGLLKKFNDEQKVLSADKLEMFFIYALCWSIGSLFNLEDRRKFSEYLVGLSDGATLPSLDDNNTLYEYFVNPETFEWELWKPDEYEYDPDTFDFATALIPTMDSVRTEFLLKLLTEKCAVPVLIVGSSGTAKTSVVVQYANGFDPTKRVLKKVNFSSATTCGMFQNSMEADIEKRQGKTFAPAGGRHMTVFLDDLSMPEVNTWGDQPTLEIVRQVVEEHGFMFLEKDKRGEKMDIENVIYVGAMNHPGGGRNDIPGRLKRHFFTLNCPPLANASIDNIYGTMLRGHFDGYEDELALVDKFTGGTIELWSRVKAKMLPTPSKFHYIFNLRDVSRIFQGVLFGDIDGVLKGDNLLCLWLNECERVLCDKLVSEADKNWYKETAWKVAEDFFGEEAIAPIRELPHPIYFVDFLRNDEIDEDTDMVIAKAPKIYEMVGGEDPVLEFEDFKPRVEDNLLKHNQTAGNRTMDLVLFQDALEHMLRISRILAMPRGNALLVGVGGSGRQSLTRLAAFIADHEIFQMKITRSYKIADFEDDLRFMYTEVGKEGKNLTWIFTDFEILFEEQLEYINGILATGEVAGLFAKDERDMMCADLRGPAKERYGSSFDDTPDNLYKFFLDRIRSNLHIVLVFSPANEKFSERARKFPGLIGCCNIDWFLRWPEQALVDVSEKFLAGDKSFQLEASEKEKEALVRHIASVHNLVTEGCQEYFKMYRRSVFVTPKSYLAFINGYKAVYKEKLQYITQQEYNVKTGLEKLADAEKGVDQLKVELAEQQVFLNQKEKDANIMLSKVEKGTIEANAEKKSAGEIEEQCEKTADIINQDKAHANELLQAAMPFVHAAMEAANSIKKNDINIITQLNKPPDLIKRIMDCVLLLFQYPLEPVGIMEIKVGKDEYQDFIKDSYDSFAKKLMQESDFVTRVGKFAQTDKDKINSETIELLEPYLSVKDFNAERAKTVANAAEGLCKWVRAMAKYHEAALIVGPLQIQLNEKQTLFDEALAKLKIAQGKSKAAQDTVDDLQRKFDETMAEKQKLADDAAATEFKMQSANNLIESLAGEKVRWKADALSFAEKKKKLVGDVALSCAFVSYLGAFNQVYRGTLLKSTFYKDAISKNIPITKDLVVTDFLVDDAVVAEWNSQGLPKDDLSIQNGILVTQASRYPLLIDPQNQAAGWLKKRELENFPHFGTTTVQDKKLRDKLEFCMEEGKSLIVEGVVKDVDPMFDPVLEKNYTYKGRNKTVVLGDKNVGVDDKFLLFFITMLGNPTFSPELSAKTTIIDFSVTQKGLEDQLLSRVIQAEQKALEDERQALIEAVNEDTIALLGLDKDLLDRLSNSQGSLLEDVALIETLSQTKIKAGEVKQKITAAKETENFINQKREQYRSVATRAAVIYFVLVNLPQVNVMYQISLGAFLGWFDYSIDNSAKANLVAKRVEILIDYLTYHIYKNVSRGLFEEDKLTYKLMLTMQINRTERPEVISPKMIDSLLRGGATLNPEDIPRKPFEWMTQQSWVEVVALSIQLEFFGDIKNTIEQNQPEWRKWYESENPEDLDIPKLEERLSQHPSGPFMRLLIIQVLRRDRFTLAVRMLVTSMMGKKYTDPESIQLEDIWGDASKFQPVILLLTPGADPTISLQELAKKKMVKINAVSMGEGQEKYAKIAIKEGMETGNWALLQNCHLGLGFMNQIDTILDDAQKAEIANPKEQQVDEKYRTWITCEPHNDFPINLLQMSIKVTNEPPAGMKAGLHRSYTTAVDTERLQRVEVKEWRQLVFTICFLHSTVQERRKFGAIGWCIPYEFNGGDLEATLLFTEKHFFAAGNNLSWQTIQYMLCEVQYGGRITDDWDRILFNNFGDLWMTPHLLDEDFSFFEGHSFNYNIPDYESAEGYLEHIADYPSHDSPEIFGLHTNADLTYGTSEANRILQTINDTQPAVVGGADGGKTKEEIVSEKCAELLEKTPESYNDAIVRDQIRKRSRSENEFVLGHKLEPGEKVDGFSIPLNVFLYQEVTRINGVINNVSKTFNDVILAINGDIIMTPELQNALNFIYDGKPPVSWYIDPSGAKMAWSAPSLPAWFDGLIERNNQLHKWLNETRPITYWMTGFFNPQGFLTAARQEMTRRHKAEKWALDDVTIKPDVTDYYDLRKIKEAPSEGFYIQGLFLQGASWEKSNKTLRESAARELFTPLPVLKITAIQTATANKIYGSGKYYDCPCYTMPSRTDLNYVFVVKLATEKEPTHWISRGVALLCSKD